MRASCHIPRLFWVFLVMARAAQAHEVIHLVRKLRVLVDMLDMMHCRSLYNAAVSPAMLT